MKQDGTAGTIENLQQIPDVSESSGLESESRELDSQEEDLPQSIDYTRSELNIN